FFITVALTYTGGLQGTGDTRSPLFITLVSQVAVPLGICFTAQAMGSLQSTPVWSAILAGHITRGVLSVLRFQQGHWRRIAVERNCWWYVLGSAVPRRGWSAGIDRSEAAYRSLGSSPGSQMQTPARGGVSPPPNARRSAVRGLLLTLRRSRNRADS